MSDLLDHVLQGESKDTLIGLYRISMDDKRDLQPELDRITCRVAEAV